MYCSCAKYATFLFHIPTGVLGAPALTGRPHRPLACPSGPGATLPPPLIEWAAAL